MRPVTRSRRNEKNRERSVDGAPAAAADPRRRRPRRSRSRARPAGRPASVPGRRRAAGSEARAAGRRRARAEGLEHVGADLERRRARCTAPSQAAGRAGAHAAPSHSASIVRLDHARRPGRASRRARRRPRCPSARRNSTGRQSATMHRAGDAGLGRSTRRRPSCAPARVAGVEPRARGRRAPGSGRPARAPMACGEALRGWRRPRRPRRRLLGRGSGCRTAPR